MVAKMKNEILGNKVDFLPTIYEDINMLDLVRVDEDGNTELCMIFVFDYNFFVIPSSIWER